jgi:Flp pilus assembly pilin Flp
MKPNPWDDGPTFTELGLIFGLVAVVVIVALFMTGGQISSTLHMVSKPV